MIEVMTSMEFELPLVSLVILLILSGMYYVKKSVKAKENVFFEYILTASSIYALLNTLLHYLCALHDLDTLNNVYYAYLNTTNKVLMFLIVSIAASLFCYNMTISYKKIRSNFKPLVLTVCTFMFAYLIIIIPMDITLIEVGTVTNATGSMLNVTYIFTIFFVVNAIMVSFMNYSKNDKRYNIMIYVLLETGVMTLISYVFPGIMIYDFILALLCFIMYHSIENPDEKLIQKLDYAVIQAKKANQAKTDFLSSMSHEIRTPLNAIVGLSEDILYSKRLSKSVEENAENIVAASHTLLEIVGNIIDITKIESQKVEIVNTNYSIKEVIDEVVKVNEFRIKNKDIETEIIYKNSVPEYLYGDRQHIKLIANNFISNAFKYTKKGVISIIVDYKKLKNDSSLELSVIDTGIGIKQEKIDRLFSKFDRLDEEKNSNIDGTGLGLSITKQLVELLEGEITVQSEFGVGSQFTVIIPQVIGEKPLVEQAIDIKDIDIDLSKLNILVVDDNELNLKVAKKALPEEIVNVDLVSSGEDCISYVTKNKYDLILLDIMMPGMNGSETLKILKQNTQFNIPVIACTADALVGAKEKYIEEGFSDYISKPFNRKQLKETIIKTLSMKK